MAHLVIGKVLDSVQGVKKDGSVYVVPEELDLTLFISLGHEVLQVARASRIELGGEQVAIGTHKGERFFFPPDHVVGVRLGVEQKANRGSAGFR
jgi:hypothetical protein